MSLLSIYLEKMKTNSKRYMHPNAHCSTRYNSQDMKQPKCPLTDEWIKMWYIYIKLNNGILLSHKKEIMPFAATWMDPEIILSEVKSDTNII